MAGIGRRSGKSGRKQGSVNKNKAPAKALADQLGIDPLEVLLLFAKGDWESLGYKSEMIEVHSKDYSNFEYVIDPAVRKSAAADACKYLYPQLKQIDARLKVNPSDPDQPGSEFSNEEIAEMQNSLQNDRE